MVCISNWAVALAAVEATAGSQYEARIVIVDFRTEEALAAYGTNLYINDQNEAIERCPNPPTQRRQRGAHGRPSTEGEGVAADSLRTHGASPAQPTAMRPSLASPFIPPSLPSLPSLPPSISSIPLFPPVPSSTAPIALSGPSRPPYPLRSVRSVRSHRESLLCADPIKRRH